MSDLQPLDQPFSTQFCSPDSDITLRSCDGVVFKFYKKNLECHSAAFAGAGKCAVSLSDEIIDFEETSQVLELLLQFMTLQRQPDLTELNIALLAPLAEAVEKYEVFSAMTVCNRSMKAAIPLHCVEVLEYAAKHGYTDIMDTAAVAAIGVELVAVQRKVSSRVLTAWLRYFQFWLDALGYAHNNVTPGSHMDNSYHCRCHDWDPIVAIIGRRLGARLESLKDLDDTFRLDGQDVSYHIKTGVGSWKNAVASRVNQIPKFSTLL